MKRAWVQETLAYAVLLAGLAVSSGRLATGCKGVSAPDAGELEAGAAVATGLCSLIDGIDDDGTVRIICATVEEVVSIVAFVLTLRTADAGAPPSCVRSSGTAVLKASAGADNHVVTGDAVSTIVLPGTAFCATSAERAKAILFITNVRASRLTLEAGAR